MPYCPNCGKEWPDDALFCGSCGTKLEPDKPACAAEPVEPVVPEESATPEELSTSAEPTEPITSDEPSMPVEPAVPEESTTPEEQGFSTETAEETAATATVETEGENQTVEEYAVGPVHAVETPAEEPLTAQAPVAVAAATAPVAGGTAAGTAAATSAQPDSPKAGGMPRKWRNGIIAGVLAVIAVLVVIEIIILTGTGGVPKDQVEQDFKATSTFSEGIVDSYYVDDTDYTLTSFQITSQSSEDGDFLGYDFTIREVDFTGTMKNESFETDFTGYAYYVKDNGDYSLVFPGIAIVDSTSKPLKGVDYLSAYGPDSEYCSTSNFSSTLEEDGGQYTSVASQDVSYNFWFATDTSTYTQTFVFDDYSGWSEQSEAEESNANTSWDLSGKTFKLEDGDYAMSGLNGEGELSSTLTFADIDSNNTIQADYTVNFTPSSSYENEFNTLQEVALEGTVQGTIEHEFGSEWFEAELVDNENNVTFSCSNDMTNALIVVSLTTDAVYEHSSFMGLETDYPIQFIGQNYVEILPTDS